MKGIMAISWILGVAAAATADEIVLFDAASTPLASVKSQNRAKFAIQAGLLKIETQGGTGFPGVLVKGSWDLSQCNRIEFEFANLDHKGELPLTVRLDNPNADAGNVDRQHGCNGECRIANGDLARGLHARQEVVDGESPDLLQRGVCSGDRVHIRKHRILAK